MAQLQDALWAINIAATLGLLVLMAKRKSWREYPAFAIYVGIVPLQGLLLFIAYEKWGFSSRIAWQMGWATQGLVTCFRALAVAEICRHLLKRYAGIWGFVWRILAGAAVLVLLLSILIANHQWTILLPNLQRGLELALACIVLVLLFFIRYYEVEANPTALAIARGICLYSCFGALNYAILERYLYRYVAAWNMLEMLAFLASLAIWIWGLQKSQSEREHEEILLPTGVYQAFVPEINRKLRFINEEVTRFWHPETRKP